MILYRRIDDNYLKWWENHFKVQSAVPALRDIPVWAIAPFMMTADEVKDVGGLSVFAAAEKSELEKVAAALSVKQSIESSFFVGVSKAKIEKIGIEVEMTPGTTYVPAVDQNHFEIKATAAAEISKLAKLYLAGEFEKIQKSRAKTVRNTVARNGGIEFKLLANDNKQIGNQRLAGFVSADHVLISGADQK